ncbi:hypothetical protein VTK56DRAFT_2508 [Thermocarpiscus australiensis]
MADIFACIQEPPDQVVRTVLAGLCADDSISWKAAKLFVRIARASTTSRKRKLPPREVFICLRCQQAYSEAENASDACLYHPGDLLLDYESEAWVGCVGDEVRDDEDARRDNPEGFPWTCCEKSGCERGCTRDWHQQGGSKRARLDLGRPRPSPAVRVPSDDESGFDAGDDISVADGSDSPGEEDSELEREDDEDDYDHKE